MPTGTVKWFNNKKRYGFLIVDDGSEVFVHGSVVPPETASLRAGDTVEFTIEDGDQGAQATDLRMLERAPKRATDVGAGQPNGTHLNTVVENVIRQLEHVSSTLRDGGGPSRASSYSVARSLRGLANRLNPPPA